MPEHVIRLRGAWERDDPDAPAPRRVALPLPEYPEGPGTVRLSRAFQKPRTDPRSESLWLRLDDVPGLAAVWVNGREVPRKYSDPVRGWLVPLGDDLPGRIRLVLEVAPRPPETPAGGLTWGTVALVIRGRDDGGGGLA